MPIEIATATKESRPNAASQRLRKSLPARSKARFAGSLPERWPWRLAWGWLRADPRRGQILCLSGLLVFGLTVLDFQIAAFAALASFATALGVQAVASALLRLPFDPLSPLITSFSLTFLLRTEGIALAALGAAIAIASKFLLRLRGRHVFNPANLALVALTLSFDAAWISPGQWGALGVGALLLAGFGAAVAGSAARLDTSLAFLAAWAALLFGRALWLGDPLAIPVHQLQSGAILIFAFFMISDPATTPAARPMRILHAVAVAALGFWLQMAWITETGPILALVALAPLVALAAPAARRPIAPRRAQRRIAP